MKHSIKGLFLILAIVISFVAVQNVSADIFTVDGIITKMESRPNLVVLSTTDGGETYVYGVKFKYLEQQQGIDLTMGMYVKFKVFEYVCDDGETRLKLCEMENPAEQDDWIKLRACVP